MGFIGTDGLAVRQVHNKHASGMRYPALTHGGVSDFPSNALCIRSSLDVSFS